VRGLPQKNSHECKIIKNHVLLCMATNKKSIKTEKTIANLLEEIYNKYPNFVYEDELIAKGFQDDMIRQAYGSELINQGSSHPTKPKFTLNSNGFLMIVNLKLKKSIDEFNKSSNKLSAIMIWLTIGIGLLTIAIAIKTIFFKYSFIKN